VALKATPNDYYDYLPEPGHAPGDIWLNLPTYGILKQRVVAGIVVTPACDLQNEKSETVTYLPVLEIEEWLATASWLSEIIGATQNVCNSITLKLGHDALQLPAAPRLDELAEFRKGIPATETATNDKRFADLLQRAISGLDAIKSIVDPDCTRGRPESLSILFGARDWQQRRERLVSNALRADLQFLPAMGAAASMHAALRRHSVAMFRYPMSAPVGVLDIANDVSLTDWPIALQQFAALPAAHSFAGARPIRIARLTHRFCADMLTRYCMLYNRLGSPDFASSIVARLASEIT
jgi:hypothetical protein